MPAIPPCRPSPIATGSLLSSLAPISRAPNLESPNLESLCFDICLQGDHETVFFDW